MSDGLSLVLAVARNGVIGVDGKLPWNIPEDLKHFRRVTTGHAVIMGRKTWDSIGKPLPNRRNIVLSRQASLAPGGGIRLEGADIVQSLEVAIALARTSDPEPCVIGGAEIFRLAMPLATKIYLTEIDADYAGDTFFTFDRSAFKRTSFDILKDPELRVKFITMERA